MIALNGFDGSEIWTLDLAAEYGDTLDIDHAPVIGDFDGDGKLEGFVFGGFTAYPDTINSYGRAYAFSLGDGTGPEWKMFQHDSVRSNCVPLNWYEGISKQPPHPDEMIVDVRPNPFRDLLTIKILLKKPGALSIELLDMSGNFITTIRKIRSLQGSAQVEWNAKGLELPPGMYFLKISHAGISKQIKIIHD